MKRTCFKYLFFPAVIIGAIVVLLFFSTVFSNLDSGKHNEDKKQLETAVVKAAVSCYALEGAYPPSIDYLIRNYHLQIDPARFAVMYEFTASNLMPDITVLELDK